MKTKLVIFLLLAISLNTSAERLVINSTTTTDDLLRQLIAKQPTQEEVFEAWSVASDFRLQDLADFLWPYATGEQPLPQNQAAQNEVKEEKAETKECLICLSEMEEKFTLPCCNKDVCKDCIIGTAKGFLKDEVTEVDGVDEHTQDRYEIKSCPFCREPVDFKELVDWIGTLSEEQVAKLRLLAEASGLDENAYINMLRDEDPAQIGAMIDSNYQSMVNPQQTPPRVVNNNNNNNNNNQIRAHAPRQVAPLVLNANVANAQFNPCVMVSSVFVIVVAMLMYSQLGAV